MTGSIFKEEEVFFCRQKVEHPAVLLVPSKSTTAESLVITCGPPLGAFTGLSLQRSLEIEVRGMAIAAIYLGKKKKNS